MPVRSKPADGLSDGEEGVSLLELVLPLLQHWKLLAAGSLLAGLLSIGATYLIEPTFTSRTVFLPPQRQQNSAASALAAISALSGLVGTSRATASPADQFVALLQSTTVADRLIDEFKLMQVYKSDYRVDARKELATNVRITLGKKDGLITIEVDDAEPQRAADIANRHVDELRHLTSQLALTEAQQRRLFFENQLKKTRDELSRAQQALQASGFNPGALKAEPKAAAEGYARLRAEVTAAEVRLQSLRRNLSDDTPEVAQAQTVLGALRAQLGRMESMTSLTGGPDYVSKFREFKYQETLFELIARQYELARMDEGMDGSLIQVVDLAKPAERKSGPKRGIIAITAAGATLLLLSLFVVMRSIWRQSAMRRETAATQVRATLD